MVRSLAMTSLWDDNYMILNSNYEKSSEIKDDFAKAINEYVANTLSNSNIAGENFVVPGASSGNDGATVHSKSNTTENFEDAPIKSISEYVDKKCGHLKTDEADEHDTYSYCKLGAILENQETDRLSEYKKKKREEHEQKLKKKSRNSSKSLQMAIKGFKLNESSASELYNNTMMTMYNIIEDLGKFDASGNDFHGNVTKVIQIFVGNGRLMYIGIVVLVVSFLLYLIDASS